MSIKRRFRTLSKAVLVSGSAFLFSCGVYATGTTSSGGAEFIGDGHNPWFIQNTSTVNYCIIHDPNTFHLPAGHGVEILSEKIRRAIEFWKKQFKATVAPVNAKYTYQVATQNFVETPCDLGTHIRFQFGTLDSAQLKALGDPQKFLAGYVRTAYDKVNLRGAGFIYLSADSGPLAPSDQNIASMPWARGSGGLITLALIHELGHVFGLSHNNELGYTYHDKVMGEEYIQWMLHPFNADQDSFDQSDSFRFFTYGPGGGTRYGLNNRLTTKNEKIAHFFGYDGPVDSIFYDFSEAPLLKVYRTENDNHDQAFELGRANLTLIETRSSMSVPTQRLWITHEQSLFPCQQKLMCGIPGPSYRREDWTGVFKSNDGKTERQILLQRSPDANYNFDKFRVGGVLGTGKIYLDLMYELRAP